MTNEYLDPEDVKHAARRLVVVDLLKYLAIVILVAGFASISIQILNLTEAVRETQQKGSPAVKAATDAAENAEESSDATQALLLQFKDCIEPQGECFKAGQKRSANVVANVNEVTVAAAGCAVGIDVTLSQKERYDLIWKCVIDRLANPSEEKP